MQSRFFCILNIITFLVLSILVYFGYQWVSNYMSFSNTYLAIPVMYSSPLFYLTVLFCTGLCFIVDLFVTSFKFNFLTTPACFLRNVVSKKQDIDAVKPQFDEIFNKIRHYYIQQDVKREDFLEKRREELARIVTLKKASSVQKVKPEQRR